LFGFKGRDTEYRVSLLPLGGYVKFAGDNPYEEVAPEDRGRGFLEQPPWKKGLIAFAGPAATSSSPSSSTSWCSQRHTRTSRPGWDTSSRNRRRRQAGLRYGDRILAIDGEPVEGWSALQEKVRAHAGQPLAMEIERGAQRLTVRVVPAVHEETDAVETVKHGGSASRPPRGPPKRPSSPGVACGTRRAPDVRQGGEAGRRAGPNWEDLEEKLAARTDARSWSAAARAVPAPGGTLWSYKPVSLAVPGPDKPGGYGLEAAT